MSDGDKVAYWRALTRLSASCGDGQRDLAAAVKKERPSQRDWFAHLDALRARDAEDSERANKELGELAFERAGLEEDVRNIKLREQELRRYLATVRARKKPNYPEFVESRQPTEDRQ